MMSKSRITSLLLAVTGGWMMSLSFPPYNLPILQFPAWILLLRLGESDSEGKGLFGIGYLYLLVWNLITTYWLMMATFAGGLAAILANSLVMSAPLWLIWKIQRTNSQSVWINSLLIAGIWTSFEFFHHHWQLSWPWLTLANAWSVWPQTIQWISITGHLGITFWVVFVSSLFFFGIRKLQFRNDFLKPVQIIQRRGKSVLLGGLIMLILPLYSWFNGPITSFLFETDGNQEQKTELEIIVVQPDQNSNLSYGGHGSLDLLIDHLASLTEGIVTPETDLILWPENAVDGAVQLNSAVSKRLQELSDRWNAELITGAMLVETYPEYEGKAKNTQTPDLIRLSPDGMAYNIYNAALHFRNGSLESPETPPFIYKKANLVPIVERVPYVETLHRLPLISRFDWGSLQGYGKGNTASTFSLQDTFDVAPLICYDSVYPDWIRKFVLNGASILTVVTNDGWWGNTSGHVQHFEYARLRAIEFHRPVIRSANNGISGVITPSGNVTFQTEYAIQDVFMARIPLENGLTFYAKYGSLIGWFSLFLTFLSLILLWVKRGF